MSVPSFEYTPSQKWVLAAIACYTEAWGDSFTSLGGYRLTVDSNEMAKESLKDSWSIQSKEELLSTLDWLKKEGHRSEWDRDDLLAWDLVRHMHLVGLAYLAGYVEEKEAWELSLSVAPKLQAQYSSWKELGAKFIEGRKLWGEDQGNNKVLEKACKDLLNDEASLWRTVDWRTPLKTQEALFNKEEAMRPKFHFNYLLLPVFMLFPFLVMTLASRIGQPEPVPLVYVPYSAEEFSIEHPGHWAVSDPQVMHWSDKGEIRYTIENPVAGGYNGSLYIHVYNKDANFVGLEEFLSEEFLPGSYPAEGAWMEAEPIVTKQFGANTFIVAEADHKQEINSRRGGRIYIIHQSAWAVETENKIYVLTLIGLDADLDVGWLEKIFGETEEDEIFKHMLETFTYHL